MTELDTWPQLLKVPKHNRDAANQVVQCINDRVYCALLGPRLSGKTELLRFVQTAVAQDLTRVCVYIDLQEVRASTRAGFFARLVRIIAQRVAELAGRKWPIPATDVISSVAFRGFLRHGVARHERDLVLMIDHLEAVPNDLVQALLTSLRAAYMDQQLDEHRLVAVVCGALSLATITVGESSPFRGIARRVFVGDLAESESEALIAAGTISKDVGVSPAARTWLLRATRGDPYLIATICDKCVRIAGEYPSRKLTAATVKRVLRKFICDEASNYKPLREAVQLVEDDPDLLCCVLLLLERNTVPRRELPLPLSPDLDPLYLTGLVGRINEENYALRNEIYRRFLAQHFDPGRVGHVLTMAGRWDLAIDYLERSLRAGHDRYRAELLAATIHSMYAADNVKRAAYYLTRGLSAAFGVKEARIWHVSKGENILRLVGQLGSKTDGTLPIGQEVLISEDRLEARAYRETRSLRGQEVNGCVRRAMPLLIPGRKPIGVAIICDYLLGDELTGQRERDLQLMGYLNQAARVIQEVDMRQYRRKQERRRRQLAETLRETSAVIGGSLELDEVLKLILEQMARVLPFDTASVQLLNSNHTGLEIIAYKGFDDPVSVKAHVFPLEDVYPNVRVWRCKEPMRCGDVRELFPHSADPKYHATRVRGWLGVPLVVSDEAIGVITLDSFTPDLYTLEHEQLAMVFASHAALAIDNARLFEQAKSRAEELATLADVAKEVSATITEQPREILDSIVQGACRITGADCAVIYPFLPGRLAYDISNIAAYGLRRPRQFSPKAKIRQKGKSLTRSVVEQGIRVVHDVTTDPDTELVNSPFVRREEIRAFVGLGLSVGGESLGVLFVNFRHTHQFVEEELDTIHRFASHAAIAIMEARLFQRTSEALGKRVAEMETLQEINTAIISTLELNIILEMILDRALDLTEATCGTVQLVSEDGQELVLVVEQGATLASIGERLKLGEGVTGKAAQEGHSYRISDVQSPQWARIYRAYIPGMRSELAVPMRFEGQVIGVINIESADTNAFSEDDARLLEGLARQAAIAIQNARLFDSAQRRIRDMEIINDIVQIIGTKLDTQDLLQAIVFQIADQLKCTHCTLWFPQEERGELLLVPQVTHGVRREQIMTRRFRPGEGLAGWVFQQGESLVLPDARQDSRFSPAKRNLDRPRSMLVVPVKVGDRTIGVISADQEEFDWFSESDRRLVDALARQAGIAIERATALELLHDVGKRIISSQAVDDILQQIVSGAIELTNTTSGVIYLISEDGKSVTKSFQHPPDFVFTKPRMAREEGVTRQVIATGEMMVFPDIRQDARVNPVLHDRIRSVIAVPLKLDERKVIGVLYLNDANPHSFTETEVSLLSTLATQAAIAIVNARLLQNTSEALEKRVAEMETLQQINDAITSTLELNTILEMILDRALDLIEATYGTVQLVSEDGRELVLVVAQGATLALIGERLRLREGVTGKAAQDGHSYRISDVQSPQWARIYRAYIPGMRSELAVPMCFESQVVGVINLESADTGAFSEDDERLLVGLARQAAIAIKNARLFDSAQRRIRDLEIVNDIVQIIGTKLGTQDLLQAIVSQIADQLKCTHCTLFFAQKEQGELLLVPQVTHGVRGEQIMTRRFRPGEGLAGWVFQQGESLVLPDARQDPRFSFAKRNLGQPRSMLVVPVKVGDQTIGVISADQDELGWFSESDRRLVDALARQAGIAIERATALELLHDIGNRIISSQAVDDILQQIVSGAIRLTNTTSGVIYLISEDGKSVTKSFQHPPGFDHPKPRLDRKEGLTRQVIATGDMMVFPDIRQDARVNPVMHDRVRSMIAVPLKLEQKVIGVLYLNDANPHSFTETEVSLLSTLATQAAIAIVNARLLQNTSEALEKRVAEMETLQEINDAITSTLEINTILEMILDRALELTEATDGTVQLVSESEQELVLKMARGATQAVVGARLGMGEGVTGRAAQDGRVYRISDVQSPQWARIYRAYVPGMRSELAVPMRFESQVVGVINLESADTGAFSEDDARLLEGLARQAAIAIQNARLFDSAQRRIRDLEIINDIVQIIGTKLDTQDLLQAIVFQIADQLKCTHCTLWFPQEERGELLLVPQVTYGVRGEQIMTRRFKPREGLVGWVFQQGESLVLPDDRQDPRFSPARRNLGRPRSVLVVPVKVGDRTIGVISADQEEFDWFSESDRRLVDALARQVGIAIERATALELLHDVGKRIISSQAVDDILQQIVSGAIKLTNTTAGVIDLISKDGKSVTKSFQHPPGFDHPKPRLDRKEGVTRQMIATGKMMVFPDIRQDARVNPVLHDRVRSVIAVPLKLDERKVIGVLYLNDAKPHSFTETEVSLLSTLATQAAIAIQNAKQYEALSEAQDELLASGAIAWMGLFGSEWSHTVAQKTYSIRSYVDILRDIAVDGNPLVGQALDSIDVIAQEIQGVPLVIPSPADTEKGEPVLIDSFVRKLIKGWCEPHESVHLVLDLRCCDALVRVDEPLLKMALQKLIDNALRHMPGGGTLRVESRIMPEEFVTIALQDTGCGIPDEHKPLFGRRRIPKPQVDSGSGMGALLARFILRKYNGDLELVWSEKDKGTRLEITLPIYK